MDDLRTNLAAFIDEDYNGTRLLSALGSQPSNEFERRLASGTPSGAARMPLLRPAEEAKTGGTP